LDPRYGVDLDEDIAAITKMDRSIRVNSQWRLIFRWDGRRGEASGVYLDDHSYR
jgi:plasmid maintenance system killer protein